jgi:hypothetical protein
VSEHFVPIDDDLRALEDNIVNVRHVLQLGVALRASDAASVLWRDEWKIVIAYSEYPHSLPLAFSGKLVRNMSDGVTCERLASEIAHTRGLCRNDCALLAQPAPVMVCKNYPDGQCPYWASTYRPLDLSARHDGRQWTLTLC